MFFGEVIIVQYDNLISIQPFHEAIESFTFLEGMERANAFCEASLPVRGLEAPETAVEAVPKHTGKRKAADEVPVANPRRSVGTYGNFLPHN